jgi:hypothetical protein
MSIARSLRSIDADGLRTFEQTDPQISSTFGLRADETIMAGNQGPL